MKIFLCILFTILLGLSIFSPEITNHLHCDDIIPNGYSLVYNEKSELYAIKKGDKFVGRYTDGIWGYKENPEPTVFTDTCEAKYFLEMAVDYFTKLEASEKRWELN